MSGPVDILSMLNKAQAKCDQQNSVAAFFNGFADKNVNSQTSSANNIDSLEQIERQFRPAKQQNGEFTSIFHVFQPHHRHLPPPLAAPTATAPDANPLAQLFFKSNQPKTVAAAVKEKPKVANGNTSAANKSSNNAPPPGFQLEKKLITPTMLLNSSQQVAKKPINAPVTAAQQQQPKPLTKSQLIEAVQFLMETDEEFVTKVHDAYLKTVSSQNGPRK